MTDKEVTVPERKNAMCWSNLHPGMPLSYNDTITTPNGEFLQFFAIVDGLATVLVPLGDPVLQTEMNLMCTVNAVGLEKPCNTIYFPGNIWPPDPPLPPLPKPKLVILP